jgi:predicted transcriptional regulator
MSEVCRFCGKGIQFQKVEGGWVVVEPQDDGSVRQHAALCTGKDKRAKVYAQARRESKAAGFHGVELDREIWRRVYGDCASNAEQLTDDEWWDSVVGEERKKGTVVTVRLDDDLKEKFMKRLGMKRLGRMTMSSFFRDAVSAYLKHTDYENAIYMDWVSRDEL